MKKKVFAMVAVLLMVVAFMPGMASAIQAPSLTYASSPIGDVRWYNGGSDGNFGTSFTTASNFTVAKLGFYDANGDGLAYSHDVGLWNAAGNGTLLGQVTIAAGTVAPLADGFRWANLSSSVLLSANNTYILGATMAGNNQSDLVGTTATINFPFTKVGYGLYHDNIAGETGLQMPDERWDTVSGLYGPNAAAVPIPPTVWLLGSGLFGLVGLRRRFKK